MITYLIVTPESEADANYAQFEYMLGWYDFNGNWQQHLFTDWQNSFDYDNEVYNKNKTGHIGSTTKEISNSVMLSVEDCSINDLKVYRSIFEAEQVLRIFKDGTTEVVAPDSNSVKYAQRGIRFALSFELMHAA